MQTTKNRRIIGVFLILTLIFGVLAGCGKVTRGTITLQDGSNYVGQIKNNSPEGKGTVYFPNGNKYVGEFTNGQIEGKGTFTWANGDRYVGDFKNGAPNGKGVMYKLNGKMEMNVTAKDGNFTVIGTPKLKAEVKQKGSTVQQNKTSQTK